MFMGHIGWFLAISVAAGGPGPDRTADRPPPNRVSTTESFQGVLTLAVLGIEPQETPKADPHEQDAREIQAMNKAFQEAYDKGDAEALAALFLENGEVVNDEGLSVQGRSEIAAHFKRAFEANPGETITLDREDLSFLGPNLAREAGLATTKPSDGGPPETSLYRALLMKVDGRWLQATVNEYKAIEPTAHERLEDLSWMIGDWIDESEDAVVETQCDWSPDGSYLIREFLVQVGGQRLLSGTQRIGWDPRSKQFKSWVFDPDGGYSKGEWTRVGPREWRVRARGVLADGTEVSATQTIASDHQDRIRWRSYDRSLLGQSLPDLPEFLLVRKPPAPAATEKPKD